MRALSALHVRAHVRAVARAVSDVILRQKGCCRACRTPCQKTRNTVVRQALYLSFMSRNMRAESSQQTPPILYPCPGSHSEDVYHTLTLSCFSHRNASWFSKRNASSAHRWQSAPALNSFSHTPLLAKEHNTSFYPSLSHGDGIAQIHVNETCISF